MSRAEPTEGDRVVRGALLRVGGYGVGLLATAVSSLVLLRHLGVDDYGRFVTVIALVGIVGGLSDLGLTVIGQRGYQHAGDAPRQRDYLSVVLGLRLVITPPAVALVTAFALIAGYDSTMVAGTAIAGAGLVFSNAALTFVVPSAANLRMLPVTAVEVSRQLAIAVGIVVCAVVGAALLPFFWVYAAAGVVTLATAAVVAGRTGRVRPSRDRERWRALAREAAPVALSLAINVVYLRLLVLLVSIVGSEHETGLFGASARVLEVLIGVPQLMVGAAFPLLVDVSRVQEQHARLGYALQRLAEAALLGAVLLVVPLVVAAEPVMRIVGGDDFVGAGAVLELQAFGLIGAFLAQVWVFGLLAVRRDRALIWINAGALGGALVLGLSLVPPLGAEGAALASVAGELVLAGAALTFLRRARPATAPQLDRLVRPFVVLAAGLGAGFALRGLDLSDATAGGLALAVAVVVAVVIRAVPAELFQALRARTSS